MDRLALRWLRQLGGGYSVRASDAAALRLLGLACLACLICLPALSALVLSPALALPVGASLMLATFLSLSAAAIALSRGTVAEQVPEDNVDHAFDVCPGVVFHCDVQGAILKCGGRDRALLPAMRFDRPGLSLAELVHVSDRIAVAQALDALRQGATYALVDVRIERGMDAEGDRQFLTVRLDLSPVTAEDGDLRQIFVQLRDVTEEVGLREEIQLRTADAQSANDAKSRFLAAVSHELRTPLNAILGFSDVLAGEYFGALANDRQREYVSLIRQSGGHLLSVVNTMLDMSRIESGRYELLTEHFRIAEAVETCRAMLDLQARNKGVTLTARVSRSLGEVVADRRAVQQILINLAGNAIKFTQSGGVVSIDASQQGTDLKLTVSDTGIGIAAEKMALIGQPFMQVQDDYARAYEGTGLGLSLVKGLVALHGGNFTIESRLGEGTVVTILIPVEGPGERASVHDAGDAIEFPPRLRTVSDACVASGQGLAHDRAKAKRA
ncbi:HAMP domain-containing sensor histidine kinase [Rhizobium sp. FY34]|uniref:sensor histidine kinase n=1 Tax=Rhizobium sp. FY34 TaxID=2562309 RepID=UPI0010C0FFFB|nr:HAMP domain-containing sensor histidine kinase [Rhizobium sp. FY34]